MYTNARSVSRNANSGGQNQARPQPIPSCQGVGYPDKNAPELGARCQGTARTSPRDVAAQNGSRSIGGQASLGLFGAPGFTGRPLRRFQALVEDQVRRLGGLTFRQRAARLPQVVAPALSVSAALRPTLSMDELMAKYRRQPAPVAVAAAADDAPIDGPQATPAMLACAAARDMREAFPFFHDEEAWERDTLFGHVELALAQDA